MGSPLPQQSQHTERSDDTQIKSTFSTQSELLSGTIDKVSNDTVPNHTLITTNRQALFIYNRTKIAG